MTKDYRIEFKWAFIFMGALLSWSIVERLLGFHDRCIEQHPYFSLIFAIPAISLYALALGEKKRTFYNGQMTFKLGFMSGMLITLILTLFTPFIQFVILELISPDFLANLMEYSVKSGHDSLEDAQAFFTYSNYAVQSSIWALLSGVITTLLVAFFVQTRKKSDKL